MKNPPRVKSGDRVRVEIEGAVTYTAADSAEYFDLDRGDQYLRENRYLKVWPNADDIVSITPAPAPVKVGDVLATQDDYDRASVGTIARDSLTGFLAIKMKATWRCVCEIGDAASHQASCRYRRTVIYVPTEATS